jgi:hypothetical protein
MFDLISFMMGSFMAMIYGIPAILSIYTLYALIKIFFLGIRGAGRKVIGGLRRG